MPYDIELMSVGVDLYLTLAASAALLNGIQQEFHVRLTTQAQPTMSCHGTELCRALSSGLSLATASPTVVSLCAIA